MSQDIDSGTKTICLHKLNKEFSFKFSECYSDLEMPEEVQRRQQPKHCDNNQDVDISLNATSTELNPPFLPCVPNVGSPT